MHDLIQLALDGNYQDALKIHLELLEINNLLFIETNPIPVKHALFQMNMIKNEIRLPLYYMEEVNKQILEDSLRKYKLI